MAGYQKEHGLKDLAGHYVRPHLDAGLELLAESKVQSEQRAAEKAAGKAASGEEPQAKKTNGKWQRCGACGVEEMLGLVLHVCVCVGGGAGTGAACVGVGVL